MTGSWTLLALVVVVTLLLIALDVWLTTRGSAGARARMATAGTAPDAGSPDASGSSAAPGA